MTTQKIGDLVQTVAAGKPARRDPRKLTTVSSDSSQPSLAPADWVPLAKLLAESAPTAKPLTEDQQRLWYRFLCDFPPELVRDAVCEFVLSGDPWPTPGKLYQVCRRRAAILPEYAANGSADISRPTTREVRRLAEKLGL